jgi:hypothetical protein
VEVGPLCRGSAGRRWSSGRWPARPSARPDDDGSGIHEVLLAHDGSNRSFDPIGIAEGHHNLSHHQNRPDWIETVAEIDRGYVRQLAVFLDKLQATKDVAGKSLLHNAMIISGSGKPRLRLRTGASQGWQRGVVCLVWPRHRPLPC